MKWEKVKNSNLALKIINGNKPVLGHIIIKFQRMTNKEKIIKNCMGEKEIHTRVERQK